MILPRLFLFPALAVSPACALDVAWSSATDVPVTAAGYTAAGQELNCALNFAPSTGTELIVVKNTGVVLISGAFSNLAQGQAVTLTFAGQSYEFAARYYGGTGNDLVLVWKGSRLFAWGYNYGGQPGAESTANELLPAAVFDTGVLSGKTVLHVAAGQYHSLALCSDGTVAARGHNGHGELGTNAASSRVPVLVNAAAGTSALSGKTVGSIATGFDFSVAWCRNGTVVTWCRSNNGQLGNNTLTQRLAPGAVVTTTLPAGAQFILVTASSVSAHALAIVALPSMQRTPLGTWRLLHFGTAENAGGAANTFDADGDGLANFMEFAFGTHPREAGSRALPQGRWSDGFVIEFTQPDGVNGVNYGAEWSTTMLEESWTALTDTGVPPRHVFRAPAAPSLFVHLRLTVP